MKSFSLHRPIALTGAIALALALLAPLAPARAATVSYSLVLPTAAADLPIPPGTPSLSGAGATFDENVTGTVTMRKSPWSALNSTLDPNAATSVYSALYNNGGKTAVSASFDFGGVFNQLSLVWGTPSQFNSLALLLGGIAQVTMTGADAAALVASAGGNRSVLVTLTGWQFDEMVIGADHRALEFANLQTAAVVQPTAVVPVPAAGLMLVAALGGLALLRRRKAA
jgi:hypothetical protein